MADYVGQTKAKENLNILVSAANKRSEPVEHILIHGGPGLGKTTLAHIISNETGTGIKNNFWTSYRKSWRLSCYIN